MNTKIDEGDEAWNKPHCASGITEHWLIEEKIYLFQDYL
jgi:hypothetical protein